MSWTAPRTWVAGQPLNAAQLNEQVRDNLNVLAPFASPWPAYAMNWRAITADPGIGNGSIVAKTIQVGKLTFARWVVTMGSTTSYGTGAYIFTLPFTVNQPAQTVVSGSGMLYDTSAQLQYMFQPYVNTDQASVIFTASGNRLTGSAPVALATGDIISGSVIYEAS